MQLSNTEFVVDVESMIKYRVVSSNATHVTLRKSFHPLTEHFEISWEQFRSDFKPLHQVAKENTGWH